MVRNFTSFGGDNSNMCNLEPKDNSNKCNLEPKKCEN